MAKYTGKDTIVNQPAQALYDKIRNLKNLQDKLDTLPEDIKAKMGELRFTEDSLIVVTPQVGEVELKVKECVEPTKIVFMTANSPLPLELCMNFKAIDENSTTVNTSIEVDVPMMLRPLIGPQLQKAADTLGETLSKLYI